MALDESFTIEIARSEGDLESAYRLLHDCYVANKLMNPHPSGLRCNLYTFLPHSTVIVAKYGGKTVGTVSLIRDSIWGLPSDKDYLAENNRLRREGNKLVEVSALAVSKAFRGSGNAVSLLLMKYLYNYTFRFLNSDCLVCTVHPRAEDFYKALWHFDRNGKVVRYQFVQGALAVHLSMEISPEKQQQIIASYPSANVNQNLALFVLNDDSRFKYPSRPLAALRAQIDPVLTPELFEHFCVNLTGVWSTLTALEKNSLYSLYVGLFGYCSPRLQAPAEVLSQISDYRLRAYRIPVEIPVTVQPNESGALGVPVITKLTDLSTGGAFVAWPKIFPKPEGPIVLTFKIEGVTMKTKAEITWNNDGLSHLQPYGFGVKFSSEQLLAGFNLKNWLYGHAS